MIDGRQFWSPGVERLEPYVPGEQPRMDGFLKLNTNENPYPPSPRVAQAIAAAAEQGLHLYPDPACTELRAAFARLHGVAADQVFAGNGSDEVLAHAFYAFFRQPRPLLLADVTYNFYRVYCRLYGIAAETVPVDSHMSIFVDDYAGRPAGGVVLANPNAPTGQAISRADVERLLCAQRDAVVLVDEAYVDFGGESSISLVPRYPNLLVVQTLSKSRALAGLRVGFAVGQRHLIDALERVKDSFNSYPLGRPAQLGAIAALEDEEWFHATCAAVAKSRDGLARDLGQLGFEVIPSRANFLFVRHPSQEASALAERLRTRRVLVRHFRQPRMEQYLRITVGTPAQCDKLVAEIGEVLGLAP